MTEEQHTWESGDLEHAHFSFFKEYIHKFWSNSNAPHALNSYWTLGLTFQLFANTSPSKFQKSFQAFHFCFPFHSFHQQPFTAWPCEEAVRYGEDNIGFGYSSTGSEVSDKSHASQNLICETRGILPASPATVLGFCEGQKYKSSLASLAQWLSNHLWSKR